MNNILLSSSSEVSDIETLDFRESTTSSSIGEIERYRPNLFLQIMLSGAMVTGAVITASAIDVPADQSQNIIKRSPDMKDFLRNYRDVEQASDQYGFYASENVTTKQDIVGKILSFRTLCENWDGHNAIPLEVKAASNALLLVDLLGERSFENVKEIYPNPNGTITFEWNNNLNEVLNIEIGIETMSYYVEIIGKNTVYADQKLISSNEANRVAEYISIL